MHNHKIQDIRFILIFSTALICLILGLQDNALGMSDNPVPTVTVVDAETGEAIEGAVAIAIWRRHSGFIHGAFFEGGKDIPTRIEEAVSDSEGNIYIDGFWDWNLLSMDPRLTIYKHGYVCWDQLAIHIDALHGERRTDFNKDHRIARMVKWPEGFSFVAHENFVNDVTFGDHSEAQKRLFNKAFHNEIPFASKERDEINKKKKEIEEDKKKRRKMQ